MNEPCCNLPKESIFTRLKWKTEDLRYGLRHYWMNFCDWLRWLGHEPTGLERHAIEEMRLLGWYEGDDMDAMMAKHIVKMVREFSLEGHSGFSASYATNVLEKVLRYDVLSPLTGEDSEWVEVGDGVFQNKRCSRVFKENGQAYDIDGKIFREPSGVCYTGYGSRVDVTFPYIPKSEYVDVEQEESN